MSIGNTQAEGASWAAVGLCSLILAVTHNHVLFFLLGWSWHVALARLEMLPPGPTMQ